VALSFQADFWKMEFPERLARLRKERNLTQQQLASLADMHVVQINRYECGVSQPTIDALKRLAIALSVSADILLFDDAERGPDDDLRLQFEALATLPPEEKLIAKSLLEAMIVKHRVSGALAEAAAREASPVKHEKASKPEISKRTRVKKQTSS
jgi:transcriptional regulator with XRE-family HTH domain